MSSDEQDMAERDSILVQHLAEEKAAGIAHIADMTAQMDDIKSLDELKTWLINREAIRIGVTPQ